jgi:hypothetical protein
MVKERGLNMKKIMGVIMVVCMVIMLASSGWAETLNSRIGKLTFTSGYPTDKTAQKLYDELDFQRAVQAYLWALPMASYGAMADEHIRLGCGSSAVIIADNFAQQPVEHFLGQESEL